ncbi:glycosyltransferase [Merismopedia glauca]|uniref:Glycosyl transferase n=1 Tax=Merismopedia glauca CCAP 1448/3 TaxID=1296344 RepID=A0A2T1C9D4_9CYAN|nr:glycosyltransferase family 2 protein [Merismopedia glauca]PSB04851.1 glycosyl transferase [Merismopedia glauca CCAP 1448/3]
MNNLGVVVIGRNEGKRLEVCLESALSQVTQIVYVDSGSTDSSVDMARAKSVEVVELDMSLPFTAARARNEGFNRLLVAFPEVEFVQFVDGDCCLVEGWMKTAVAKLSQNPKIAVVCGRRREEFPDDTIYNKLCDLEWDTPVGEAIACGGDAMMRVQALQAVKGYNPTLIAGEEPELCVRLRQQEWQIWRLDTEMTIHDAQITKFSQWWKRTVRAGYAYAEGAYLHGSSPQKHWVKESRSIWFWGLILPLVVLVTIIPTHGLSLILWLGYPYLGYRIYKYMRSRLFSDRNSALYAAFCVLAKFPQAIGQGQFRGKKWLKQPQTLIEYKTSSQS